MTLVKTPDKILKADCDSSITAYNPSNKTTVYLVKELKRNNIKVTAVKGQELEYHYAIFNTTKGMRYAYIQQDSFITTKSLFESDIVSAFEALRSAYNRQ